MERVKFSPVGIALKQHELYGLSDILLQEQAMWLRSDIMGWAKQHFILDDKQQNWLDQQDSSFHVGFAKTISDGLLGRYDFNILFEGPSESWKSKRVSARDKPKGIKVIEIWVDYMN